jgi:hypothetical protein
MEFPSLALAVSESKSPSDRSLGARPPCVESSQKSSLLAPPPPPPMDDKPMPLRFELCRDRDRDSDALLPPPEPEPLEPNVMATIALMTRANTFFFFAPLAGAFFHVRDSCFCIFFPSLSRFHCTSNTSFATGGGMIAHANALCASIAFVLFDMHRCISTHALSVTPITVAMA